MSDTRSGPPRWAHALLESMVRPSDVESIPGDLLEEYREVKRPLLGQRGADAWYIKQTFSVLWRVVWPCVVAIVVLRILSFPLPPGWNPSLVPTPGASLLDAAVFVWAGYYGSQRSGRLITGIVTATVTSVIGFATFFIYAAITRPPLLLAPFGNPFIFVIMAILLAIAVTFGIVAGIAGAVAGRWFPPSRRRGSMANSATY